VAAAICTWYCRSKAFLRTFGRRGALHDPMVSCIALRKKNREDDVKLDSRRRENNAHPEKGRMKEHTGERGKGEQHFYRRNISNR
jgi:hypothetical protein